ncbi:scarecrow-like protein 6 [Impatiens glandulifera]|uniref:scarecrow-like protein 6 n=1 Tax=Impatiens glandulifera TaxID=253017 RepID=UPI001FB149BD|nr:scarecrow-like protein 6 [Impatiens glandulifera]
MPLVPLLDFEGKGVFSTDSSSSSSFYYQPFSNPYLNHWDKVCNFVDSIESPSPPTSTSTLSSSLIGDSAGVAAVSAKKWQETTSSNVGAESGCGSSDLHHIQPHLEISAAADGGDGGTSTRVTAVEKCSLGMEDWETVMSDSAAASPSQEQSILRWIMGDVDDPSVGLNRILQSGGAAAGGTVDYELGGGGFGFPATGSGANLIGGNTQKFGLPQNLMPISLSPSSFNPPPPSFDTADIKPTVFNPQNQQNQNQNPSFFFPMPFNQNQILQPQAKRHNPGIPSFDSVNLPYFPQNQRPVSSPAPVTAKGEEILGNQAIIDQLINAAELIQTGNSIHAQGILARLNHQLSPNGKPFYRASFYLKEALLTLLHGNNPNQVSNPFSLIFKIDAYKSLSEISPLLQFANFTTNQAILESLETSNRIHIIDFDIGYGGQWASLMQELALRSNGPPTLRITAIASLGSSSTLDHHHLELGLTRENLNHFANEIGIPFEFDVQTLDISNPTHLSDGNESIAVNLPVGGSFWNNNSSSLPSVLRFVKQLSPRIVVSVDRGCDRTDLPFAHHLINAVQSNSNLLESLDAVNVNLDVLQKIERFLIQPSMEKIVMGRFRSIEKTPHWRTLFLSNGLSPLSFSNFAESQAECVMKRTPVRGFHVEKRQSCSLVLCWQRKELISASAWRC